MPLLASLIALVAAAGIFVSYMLWPTWPKTPVSLDEPAVPITVAGVLFNVPPAAIRTAVLRYPGAHERIDLVFLWPAPVPPEADGEIAAQSSAGSENRTLSTPGADDRVFVTIAGRGVSLAPVERLRGIYPRYLEARARAGRNGLAISPFRAGTPYAGEDLFYVEEKPEQFFARCTRPAGSLPGTCIHERSLEAAEITFRFPREWLKDWRSVSTGLDQLLASLHADAR